MHKPSWSDIKNRLEEVYDTYTHRKFVHPDPLEALYSYPSVYDREVAGLIASSLAYGNVKQILRSVRAVLHTLGTYPAEYIASINVNALESHFSTFKHRFTTGRELIEFLLGIRRIIMEHGSLYKCFLSHYIDSDTSILPALEKFVAELRLSFTTEKNSLLPNPLRGSACKRLHLFLRWMIRTDAVDPGGWDGIPLSKLIIPLDTHMFRICRCMGFTTRNQADGKTAQEITEMFKNVCPDDPVRYDFALTRIGIRDKLCIQSAMKTYKLNEVA